LALKSSVLRALKILGLEEMLKLSEVLQVKQVPLKKVAGGEHIVWDEEPPKENFSRAPQKEATVLPFPQKNPPSAASVNLHDHLAVEASVSEGSTHNLVEMDMLLWQRELARTTEESFHKQEAFKGYKKATEIYSVKSKDLDGKDKVRFANTNAVLVNKKQA
jgi:hypothetical protein